MALLATLTDDYSGATLNTQWTTANGATVAGGRGSVACSQNAGAAVYSAMRSAGSYTWQGSSLTLQVARMPGVAGTDTANAQLWIMDTAPADTVARLGWEYVAKTNTLVARGQSGASYAAIGTDTNLTYDPVAHAWLRLAYTSAGSIVWSTSPDGLAWTVQRTYTTPPTWAAKTTLAASFEAFRTSGTNDALLVDNVNLPPFDAPPAGARAGRPSGDTAAAAVGNVTLPEPAYALVGLRVGLVPDQLVIAADPNIRLADPSTPTGTSAGRQGDRLDIVAPDPASSAGTGVRSSAAASSESTTANLTGDSAASGARAASGDPDVLIRGVVLPDPQGAAVRGGRAVGSEGIGFVAIERGPLTATETVSPALVETVLGATQGQLSALPILRVLADFTAAAPVIPADQAGGTTVDITQNMPVTKVRVSRGRQYELGQVEAGTATIEMQDKAELLNPANSTSPYNSGAAVLQSYRPIRVRALWLGVLYDVFTGYIERYPQTWKNAGYHGVKPMECVDVLGILSNLPVHQSYFDTIMADSPTVWIPCTDSDGPGSVFLSSPQALVSAGSALPGNPRQGTSAAYQTALLVGGTGLRMEEKSTQGGQVQWGADFLDGSRAVGLSANVQSGNTATGQDKPRGAVDIAGGSVSVDCTSSTIEFWFRFSSGCCHFSVFQAVADGNYELPNTGTNYLVGAVTLGGRLCMTINLPGNPFLGYHIPETVGGGFPDDTWHYAAFVFRTVSAGNYTVRFIVDDQVTDTGLTFTTPVRLGANSIRSTAQTYWGDPVSSGSVFGIAYYPRELTTAQLLAHYKRGVGFRGETAYLRAQRLVNTYLPGQSLQVGGFGGATLSPDYDYGVYPVPSNDSDSLSANAQPYSVLQSLQTIDATEQGLTYAKTNGRINVETHTYRPFSVALNVVLTQSTNPDYLPPVIGDRPDIGEYPYTGIEYDYDPTYVYTQTQLSKSNGGQALIQNGPTIGTFGQRAFTATLQLIADWDVVQLGMFLLARYANQILRVRQVTLDPVSHPEMWPFVLGLELSASVRINRRTSAGVLITGLYWVEQIVHDIESASDKWLTTLQLSPNFENGATPGLIFDDAPVYQNAYPGVGVLGSTMRVTF